MYFFNYSGSRTAPWGTPQVTAAQADKTLLTRTHFAQLQTTQYILVFRMYSFRDQAYCDFLTNLLLSHSGKKVLLNHYQYFLDIR